MSTTLIGRRVRIKHSAGHPIDDRLGAIRSIHRSYRERATPLPEAVESGKASARYERGVLRVELPKSVRRRRRSIPVERG
jgi:HSP20 family molecular chaperone IbpA